MPRPKSRCRGSRTTPKGTRPEGRSDKPVRFMPTPEDQLLRDAAKNFGSCADADEAETMGSAMMTLFRPQGPADEPLMDASRVLASARRHHDATAAAGVAAALGAYGPPGRRGQARSLLARLTADGAAVPEWARLLGDVAPRRAVLLADPWGDERALWIDFERPDGEIRGIGLHVDAMDAGYARSFTYGPSTEAVAAAVESQPNTVVGEISLADARAMALAGLALRDFCDAMDGCGTGGSGTANGEVAGDDDEVADAELRALIDQRIGLLPEGGVSPLGGPPTDDEFDDLCVEFTDRCAEADPDDVDWVVDDICRFVDTWCDGDPLRWSPARVAIFLAAWIPEKIVCDDEWHDAVEWVFPRWLRFAAEHRGLDEEYLEMNLATARDTFGAMRANSADPSKRSRATNILADMLADDVDLDDEDVVQDWIDAYNARPRAERY